MPWKRKRVPGRRNSKYRGPEMGIHLAYLEIDSDIGPSRTLKELLAVLDLHPGPCPC
jgi:hypothetical protein